MTPTIRLRGPADIIAVLPYHLGYRPSDSLVLVCLEGNRLAFVARLDLPPPDVDEWAVVDELLPHVLREAPDRVVLVGFETVEGRAEPVVAAMRDALLDEDIEVADRLLVRDGRWWSLGCTDGCCPAEGQPLPGDEDVPAIADYVLLGRRPAPSRADLDARLAPGRVDPTMTARCTRLSADLEAAARRGGSPQRSWCRSALSAWGDLLDDVDDDPARRGPELTHEMWARLTVSLRDRNLRDLVIAWICPGTLPLEVFEPALLELAETHLPPRGRDGARPPQEWAREHDRVTERLADLCRHGPAELSPGPLTVLASFTWWLGDGALTRTALDRALEVDPGYRLAQLLERMVSLAIRPGCAA